MDKGMEESILRPTCDARDQSLALGEAGGVDLADLLAKAEAERDKALRSKAHTEYWYAVRLERLKDLAKEHGIWPEVAAIIANGTATRRLDDGSYQYDPPTYAQQLNVALHRAQAVEAKLEALKDLAALDGEDHRRGCEGRNYACDCGFDLARDNAIHKAALALTPKHRPSPRPFEAATGWRMRMSSRATNFPIGGLRKTLLRLSVAAILAAVPGAVMLVVWLFTHGRIF